MNISTEFSLFASIDISQSLWCPHMSLSDDLNSTGHQGMHGHEFLEFEYAHGQSSTWSIDPTLFNFHLDVEIDEE